MTKFKKQSGEIAASENHEHVSLSDDVIACFTELGHLQRDKPENAMLRYSMDVGTGVMANAMEHMGDMIHRATHHAKYGSLYRGYVIDKSEKILRSLTSGYGFDKEHKENLQSNADYNKLGVDKVSKKSAKMMKIYAHEHGKLPAYNELHDMFKETCIQLGLGNTAKAANILKDIHEIAMDADRYNEMASTVYRDDKGNIVNYDLVKRDRELNESSELDY